MTRYEKYEQEIVETLQMEGVTVRPLPHTGVLNDSRILSHPQIYVIINGSKYGRPERLNVVSQEESLRAELFYRAKTRRGELGIFDLHEKAMELLLGRRLAGAKTPVTFEEFGYVAGVQNNWQFAAAFSFDIIRVERNRDETEGRITNVVFKV